MLGFIFPGQGSQQPGMGKFLVENFKIAKETFEEASDTLSLDLKKLCFDSDEKTLALTENTQPALLLVSTATDRVLKTQFNISANITAGHSIGEYAALVSSDVMKFQDAIKAVRARGIAMQAASPEGSGAMAAILGLDDSSVNTICEITVRESGFSPLSPANFNSPGQVVISGSTKAINWLRTNIKSDLFSDTLKRAKIIPLSVSAPFHCDLMKPAEDKMREFLKDILFSNAKTPVVQNYNAQKETKGDVLKENLIRQISAPVLWTQCIQKISAEDTFNFIEVGHGKVLTGLNKKIMSTTPTPLTTYSTSTLEDLKFLETLKTDGKI